MTPGPTSEHQEILADLTAQLRTFLRGKRCRVFPDTDVILPKRKEGDERVDTVVRPDLAVVCDPAKIDGKRIRGAPDLIIEILSPSTASYDFIKKRRLYVVSGVQEFWLVHPGDRIITLFHLGPTGSYGPSEYFDESSKIPVKVLPGLEIDFSLVFPAAPAPVRETPKKFRKKKR